MSDDNGRGKFEHHLSYLVSDTRYPAPHYQFAGKPHAEHPEHPGVTFDRLGFRNHSPPSLPKDLRTKRIFVVGDSTVVAGHDYCDTICGNINSILTKRGIAAEVFNFGVISSVVAQMNHLIWGTLLEYKPDQIVVICGATDMFCPWTYDPRPGYPFNFFAVECLYELLFGRAAVTEPPQELVFTEIIDKIRSFQVELQNGVDRLSTGWESAVIEKYFRSIRQLSGLADAYRTDIVAFLQPLSVTKRCPTDIEAKFVHPPFKDYLDRQFARLKSFYAKPQAGSFFRTYDLTSAFDSIEGQIFTDFVHYNSHGRAVLSAAICDRLDGASYMGRMRRYMKSGRYFQRTVR